MCVSRLCTTLQYQRAHRLHGGERSSGRIFQQGLLPQLRTATMQCSHGIITPYILLSRQFKTNAQLMSIHFLSQTSVKLHQYKVCVSARCLEPKEYPYLWHIYLTLLLTREYPRRKYLPIFSLLVVDGVLFSIDQQLMLAPLLSGFSKPFNIGVHTDSLEGTSAAADSSNRGFCLNFVQQPCSTVITGRRRRWCKNCCFSGYPS